MKIVDMTGTEVASANISGESGTIAVELCAMGVTVPLTVTMAKKGDGLAAHITIAPLNASIDAELEPSDISGMMAGMNKDVMGFVMKALVKKR